MKKSLFVLGFLALLVTGCKKDPPVLNADKSFLTFQISAVNNTKIIATDINCTISDTLIEGTTGNNNVKSSLVANFTITGTEVTVNGVQQESGVTVNDFTNPVIYLVRAQDGTQKKYVVKVKNFTGLPIFYISTDAAVLSEVTYVNGSLKVDGNQTFTDGLYDGKIQIRGRGNSTWYQEKKPYKIKLASKSTILGMPADKEWALLANYFDKTLMRNDVADELSERVGLTWTPRRRFVEVFLNGDYIGNYLLCETVKTGTSRVNITPMDPGNPTDTSSGYLFEVDQRLDGDQWFKTTQGVSVVMQEPDVASDFQINYIKNQVQLMEDHIANYIDVREQIDLDAWIKWVIVNEVMRNSDAVLFSSCFFYKNNNKIAMGPVWDFDQSSGSYVGNDAEGWYINYTSWIGGLFLYHPYYKQRFKEIWTQNFNSISSITNYINAESTVLQSSQKANFTRWNIMYSSSYGSQIISGGYQNEINHLTSFLDQRINWINAQVNTW